METRRADAEHGNRQRHTVERLSVRASLDEPELERAGRAAEKGDSSWQQWLDEYRRGEALVVRLELRGNIERAGGGRDVLEICNRGVWVERRADPPLIEAQVAELARTDFEFLERGRRKCGCSLQERVLHEMYVHVELAEDLRAALSACPAAGGPVPAHALEIAGMSP